MVQRFLRVFSGVINKVSKALGKTAGYSTLMLIMGVMFYEVIARYVFNSPTRFALEFAIYFQILLTASAAPYILQLEGHVSIGLVTERMSAKTRNWFLSITSIVGALYCGFLSVQMWKTAAWTLRVGTASETMGVPLAPLQFALFGGLVLLSLQFVARSYKYYQLTKS
jgi:TRAP-type C4-dicarboxylate transport system permease small subunit